MVVAPETAYQDLHSGYLLIVCLTEAKKWRPRMEYSSRLNDFRDEIRWKREGLTQLRCCIPCLVRATTSGNHDTHTRLEASRHNLTMSWEYSSHYRLPSPRRKTSSGSRRRAAPTNRFAPLSRPAALSTNQTCLCNGEKPKRGGGPNPCLY